MSIYNDSHNGCSIVVETEPVSHPVLRNLSRIKSIVIMRRQRPELHAARV